ncbi:hypothetical protein QBC36DRAFT_305792 [Triangularia setosa]|uniref:Uncharacterized protein n=1 Tax=Triangularia setosa TaxID=2587417 RepID=A0AAN6VVQ7_9PEZI|nr:hypothetical protein QBC36DRAFT_305792 [Podospora setosa]
MSSESESESEDEEEVVEAKNEDTTTPAATNTTDTTEDTTTDNKDTNDASEFTDDDIEHVEAESDSESDSENEKEVEEPTLTQEKLRKVSSGTTVVTPNVDDNDEFTVDEDSSEESDFDDGASDWTNPPAAMGTETNITALESEVGTPVEEKKEGVKTKA